MSNAVLIYNLPKLIDKLENAKIYTKNIIEILNKANNINYEILNITKILEKDIQYIPKYEQSNFKRYLTSVKNNIEYNSYNKLCDITFNYSENMALKDRMSDVLEELKEMVQYKEKLIDIEICISENWEGMLRKSFDTKFYKIDIKEKNEIEKYKKLFNLFSEYLNILAIFNNMLMKD